MKETIDIDSENKALAIWFALVMLVLVTASYIALATSETASYSNDKMHLNIYLMNFPIILCNITKSS